MNDVVGMVTDRQERMALVRFEREAKESRAASVAQGRWVGVDRDLVYITPPDSRDETPKMVEVWIEQMQAQVAAGRLRREWMDRYLAEYAAWKTGQELPPNGTPIKGWGVISPAQQESLIRAKYRTVEDLALLTEEGARMVGMGAIEMKHKAVAWLAQLNDKGPLTIKMAAIQRENDNLKGSVESLEKQVAALVARLEPSPMNMPVAPRPEEITAADILDTGIGHALDILDEALAPPKKGKR